MNKPSLPEVASAAIDEHKPGGSASAPPSSKTREEMQKLYDVYFESTDYDQRYPQPNLSTLLFLRRNGAMASVRALDFGCGSGRYALPLLIESECRLVACDISAAAIASFARRIQATPLADRVELIHGGLEAIPGDPRFDLILLLFGVLSHVGSRAERVALLTHLREMATPDSRFFISVPNIWRRRPLELLGSIFRRDRETLGDIRFSRKIAGQHRSFHYHLYSVPGLRAELAEAGWKIVVCEAESVFPEYLVTRFRFVSVIEGLLNRFVPASLGYGIRVMAVPAGPAVPAVTDHKGD